MRESVDKVIVRINADLAQIRESLKNAPFTPPADEDKEPDEVLKELDRVKAKLDGLKDQITTALAWQALFDMEASQFKTLAIASKEFDSKNRFWTMYREWMVKTLDWEQEDFSTIDVEDLQRQVTTYYKESFAFVRDEQNSPITLKVKSLVDGWRTMMPVLAELGIKDMRPEHWGYLMDGIRKAAEKAKNEQAALHAVLPAKWTQFNRVSN